jgi:hypothetical protein
MPYPVSDSVLFWIKTVHRAKVESIQRLCERPCFDAPQAPGKDTRATDLGSFDFFFDFFFRFLLPPS